MERIHVSMNRSSMACVRTADHPIDTIDRDIETQADQE
jgi:hypothetical protein